MCIRDRSEFEGNTPPDLVVEVEVTHLDGRKPNRYAELGAREMWQANFHQEKDQNQVLVTILDLQARGGPREVVQSRVLPNLTATSLAEAYWLARYGMIDELQTMLKSELVTSR